MKVWLLYTYYYDFCNVYDTLIGIYSTEEKAIMAKINEESDLKYERRISGEQTNWTSIIEDEVK